MHDSPYDLSDPLDPLNPLHSAFWSEWDCPTCASDGLLDELDDGRCPSCGSDVDLIG